MASVNESLASEAGNLKVVYGQDLIKVIPDSSPIQKDYPLAKSGAFPAVGDYFSGLVGLQLPWGFSFLGIGTENTTTNYTLGDALAGQTKAAKIYANTTVLVDNLNFQVLDRAASSGSTQAVLSTMSYTGMQMAISMRNVLEMQILHGQEGLGASSGAIATLTVTFDGATTSVGILSTLIGARVQWFQSNLTTARTAHDSSNYLTVSAVSVADPAAPTLTMVATGTTNVAAITTGDVMFIGGSRGISVASGATSVPHYEQIGIGKQLAATSGTMFDIDKAAFPGWLANQSTTGAATGMPSYLMSAASSSMSRGGVLGEYCSYAPTDAWGALNSALATNETYNQQGPSPYTMKKTGTDEIEVRNGGIRISVIPHPFQKRGKFYMWPKKEFHRIGSTDVTFAIPGKKGDEEFFYPVNGQAAMQRQCRADFQSVLLTPPSGVVATGLTY